jgi:hypothetical protein
MFALAGSAYLLALLVVHILSPKLAPVRVGPTNNIASSQQALPSGSE